MSGRPWSDLGQSWPESRGRRHAARRLPWSSPQHLRTTNARWSLAAALAMHRLLSALVALLVASCGSGAVSQAPSPTSAARPTPAPILPSEATLEAVPRFTVGQSNLGDPIENLDIDIKSTAPVSFEVAVALYINGALHPEINNCGIDPVGTCIVHQGAAHLGPFYWPSKRPQGPIVLC